jgi:hypothetical protein
MTLFEYLSVAVSIVLGVGLTHILANLGAVFRSGVRHGIHSAWVVLLLLLLLQIWWALWDFNSGVAWNQFSFFFVLLGPGLLYVAETLLIPRGAVPAGSWAQHFFVVRKPFLITILLVNVWGVTVTWLLRDLSLFHPYRATQVAGSALVFAGLLVENRRYHFVLPFVLIAWVIGSQVVFRLWPDAFGFP